MYPQDVSIFSSKAIISEMNIKNGDYVMNGFIKNARNTENYKVA